MKFIEMIKKHMGWIMFGFILCALTPMIMVLLGVSLAQALYLALWALIIYCMISIMLFLAKGIRNDLYWRKNH